MNLSIDFDTDRLLAAFGRFPEAVSTKMRIAQGQALQLVQREAKATHRYNNPPRGKRNPTGALERSTGGFGPDISPSGLEGMLELKEGIASYGKYIHEGFKSWAPDPFLYNAMKKRRRQAVEIIHAGIRDAIKEAGL